MPEFGAGLPEVIKLPHSLDGDVGGNTYHRQAENIVAAYRAGVASELRPPVNEDRIHILRACWDGPRTWSELKETLVVDDSADDRLAANLNWVIVGGYIFRDRLHKPILYRLSSVGRAVLREWADYFGLNLSTPISTEGR